MDIKIKITIAVTCISLSLFAQTPSPHQFTLSTGFSAVNNQFYAVTAVADMRFEKVNGFRFDVQYGYRILPRVHLNAGLGFVNHNQTLQIHSHHFEPTISPNADSYETENHQRRFINLTVGTNILVQQKGPKNRFSISVPIGMQHLLGVHRRYQTNGQGNWE
jgi:hypothetical protein